MLKTFLYFLLILTVTIVKILPQNSLERSFENLKTFENYLEGQDLISEGTDAGKKLIGYLELSRYDFMEVDSLYSNFYPEYTRLASELESIEKDILHYSQKLEGVGDYEIIGKFYSGYHTIVYNQDDEVFAINSRIPLNKRIIYKLEYTEETMILKSQSTFEEYELWVFKIYNGEYQKKSINLIQTSMRF